MKVVEPSFAIESLLDREQILMHIERAGRTCYKSEGKIGDDTAPGFVRSLVKRGHESVLEHVSLSVRVVCDRGVSHEIVRHRIASYCLTGDTLIRSINQKSWSLRSLYEWQTDDKRKGRLKLMQIRSIDEETRTVFPNHIEEVIFNGTKPVYSMQTESGRSIRCTANHRFYTPEGYVELRDLHVGDSIYANGKELLDNEDWLRYFYITQNHTRKETAEFIGCCESYVYRAFKKFGVVKPLSNRPNGRPGHGVSGMHSESGKQAISIRMTGPGNHRYVNDRRLLSTSGGYGESRRTFVRDKCESCGSLDHVEIHHLDSDPKNNTSGNTRALCSRCHKLWHKPGAIGLFTDRISSIAPVGEEDVFDLTVAGVYPNFVANGLVVHNSQESTRYCNYADGKFEGQVSFIRPCFWQEDTPEAHAKMHLWTESMQAAETAYRALLEQGATPQEARSVLPNSLRTEIVMTMDLREWRHFFRLRCDRASHPQMREIAIPMLTEFRRLLPEVFEDLGETFAY